MDEYKAGGGERGWMGGNKTCFLAADAASRPLWGAVEEAPGLRIAMAIPGRGDKGAAGRKEGGGGSTTIGVTGMRVPLCWRSPVHLALWKGAMSPPRHLPKYQHSLPPPNRWSQWMGKSISWTYSLCTSAQQINRQSHSRCYILGLMQGVFFIFHLLTKPFPSHDQSPD